MTKRKGHDWDKDQPDPWRPTDSDKEELWRQSVRTEQKSRAPTKKAFKFSKGGMVKSGRDYCK